MGARCHAILQDRESRSDLFNPFHYAVDIMIGPDDSGHAILAFEPGSQNCILLPQAWSTDDGGRNRRLGNLHRPGQLSAVDYQAPSMSDHIVHVFHFCRRHDPRLRKEGSVCWMERVGEQSCFERRHDLLAGDGRSRSTTLFQQRFVASPGRFWVPFADMMANRLDACREGVYMATALLGIGVQEAIVGLTSQNCFQLPGCSRRGCPGTFPGR